MNGPGWAPNREIFPAGVIFRRILRGLVRSWRVDRGRCVHWGRLGVAQVPVGRPHRVLADWYQQLRCENCRGLALCRDGLATPTHAERSHGD